MNVSPNATDSILIASGDFDGYIFKWYLPQAVVEDTSSASISNLNLNELMIYPNPSSSLVTIQSNNTIDAVSMFDIRGRLVQPTIIRINDTTIQLEVSGIESGKYIIHINDRHFSFIKN